jgi:hypothetical protein
MRPIIGTAMRWITSSRRMLFQLIGTVSSSALTLIVIPAIYAVVSASACRSSRHLF